MPGSLILAALLSAQFRIAGPGAPRDHPSGRRVLGMEEKGETVRHLVMGAAPPGARGRAYTVGLPHDGAARPVRHVSFPITRFGPQLFVGLLLRLLTFLGLKRRRRGDAVCCVVVQRKLA